MLQSMTGFGRGEAANSDVTVVVELKSVNNRFRDIQLRVPREYMSLEPRINRSLKGHFHRGRIDVFVRRTPLKSRQEVETDRPLAQEYANAIRALASALEDFDASDIPLTFILGQPGVLSVREASVDPMSEWDVLETALAAAMEDLLRMRAAEGGALHQDLSELLEDVRLAVGQLEAVTVGINDRLRIKLETRLRRMVGDRFEESRMVQEAAILADKADVSEELTRLRSHCDQFAEGLAADEPVGRRLDFLLQEMNREVNTIGSKAVDLPIHRKVVDLKATLERMREQSANVE